MKKPKIITEEFANSFGLASVIQKALGNTDKALLYNSWAIEWAKSELEKGTHLNLARVKESLEIWTSNQRLWKSQRKG